MPDYRIKISETQNEDREYHHYLITAKDEKEAKMFAMKFMERFIDDDNDPDKIENGYTFYNRKVIVRLKSIKETTKEQFKEFLLKIHTINMT
jgi:DNA-directed RNA polymerase beta' subunit